MSPRRWGALFLVVVVAIFAVTVIARAGTPSQIEAAKKADAAAASGVRAAEAGLVAARATKVATAEAVAAAEVEAPKEEPPVEEPKGGAEVARAPLGPAGSWSVAFADGFGVPMGQDSMWELKTNAHGCCNNTGAGNAETSSESPAAVHQSAANGLELRCEGLVCSGVSENHFLYELGRGATFAFQIVTQLPYDGSHNGEDPGAWGISTTRWPPEFDWFEWWGWNCTPGSNCVGGFPVYHGTAGQRELYFLPTESYWRTFHTYTTLVEGSTFTEYIDGARKGSFVETVNTDRMEIALTHALRETGVGRSSSFDVRSVAVYEDAAHAGQFIVGGGLAPGTTLK